MTIMTIEESELPESYALFSKTILLKISGTNADKYTIASAGAHPRCRLVRGSVMPIAYSTSTDVIVVEDGDGNDATADLNVGTTVNTVADLVPIQGQVFERNEAIILNRKTVGNAANAEIVELQFENIH